MRVISFKADEDLYYRLETLSQMTGKTKSEIIRAALRQYFLDRDPVVVITRRVRMRGARV